MQNDATTELIKEMTTNLLYLGTGVFALVGGILAAMVSGATTNLRGRRILVISLGVFGISLVLGLVVFGMMTAGTINNDFDPKAGPFRAVSATQILTVGAGSILFFVFLYKNIWE